MRAARIGKRLIGPLAGLLLLFAAEARAETKDAFYDPAAGNFKSTVGEGLHIDTTGKVVDFYLKGTDGTAVGSFYLKCAEADSTDEDDWSVCSPTYEISGETKISLSVAHGQWQKVYVDVLTTGTVTGKWILEAK